jgi:two-component system, LytTR family, sensor kinase
MSSLVPSSLRSISQSQTEERSLFIRVFPSHPKIAWLSIAGVWIGYLIFSIIQARFGQKLSIESLATHYLALTCVCMIATWPLYRMTLIFRGSEIFQSLLFLFTLPSLILALALKEIDLWIGASSRFFPQLFPEISGVASASNALVPYLLLVMWVSIFLAMTQNEEMKTAIGNSQSLQKITRESEQRALRYQLNPHFVFNALNSVSSLVVDNKNEQAERLVDELADYMRIVLDDEGQETVTVANEIAQQIRYLEIEKVRFPDRLYYETNIAKDAEDWKIPALIIQPLIENAIKHGVARSSKEVKIIIEATIEKNRLKLTVRNTGRMRLSESSNDAGTGLKNIADRLNVIYGPSAALVKGNSNDGMAIATLIVPDDISVMQILMK